MLQKLEDEKKKYDTLLEEKLELDEKKRIAEQSLDELKHKYKDQEEQRALLKQKIDL